MPYVIVERESNFCIYKQGADGQPEGDPLDCHPGRGAAESQLAALYANEPEAAKSLGNTGAMVAFFLPPDVQTDLFRMAAEHIAGDQQSPEDMHVTLAYLGDNATDLADQKSSLIQSLRDFAANELPMTGSINGIGRFKDADPNACYANFDAPALPDFRQRLMQTLKDCGVEPIQNHGFTPHVTLGYIPHHAEMPDIPLQPMPVKIDKISLALGDERIDLPLTGQAMKSAEHLIAFGSAIKSLGNGRVGGYLVAFGGKDLEGDYFTPETDFSLDWYPQRPVLYHHGFDKTLKATAIGSIDTIKLDKVGLWAEAQLDLHNQYLEAVQGLIDKGILGWSSGALPQAVEKDYDGRIKRWPIIEGSLTPTPAEYQRTRVTTLKAYLASLEDRNDKAGDTGQDAAGDEPPITESKPTKQTKGTKQMNDQMMAALIQAVAEALGMQLNEGDLSALVEKVKPIYAQYEQQEDTAEGVPPAKTDGAPNPDEQDMAQKAIRDPQFLQAVAEIVRVARQPDAQAIKDAVKATIASAPGQSKVGGFRAPGHERAPRITVSTKYADLDHEDMAYLATFMKGIARSKGEVYQPTIEFMREVADKATKAAAQGSRLPAHAVKAINAIKANELDTSTQAGYGDEWVPDMWLDQVWARTRLDNVVAPQFAQINMPSNPYELPIETTDPTVYKVPETSDEAHLTIAGAGNPIPDSKLATAKVILTADKLALRVGYSMESDEDSIIPFAAQLRKQGQRAIEDAIDNVYLNGDNTAAGNINLDGGTPGGTEKYYVAFKGILYTALVANGGLNAIDMLGTAPTLAQIRAVRAKLLSAYAARPQDLVIFCDFPTYMKLLGLPELLTIDKYGVNATVVTGEVGKIDNIPVLVTNEMVLAAANGKVSSTGASNTRGRLVIASKPQFYGGYRRKVSLITEYLSYYDSYQMTATVRPAFIARDAVCASILYNILV